MRVEYECTICFKIVADVDTLEGLKSDREMAECIACMVADEAVVTNGFCSYSILDSCVDVTGIAPVNVNENKPVNAFEKFTINL